MTAARSDKPLCRGQHSGDHEAQRLAAPGTVLCVRHLTTLGHLIAYSSYMVEHLERMIPKSGQWPAEDEPRHKAFESKPPLHVAALDAADKEVATLADAAMWLAHDTGEAPPDLTGLWLHPMGRVLGAPLDHIGAADRLVLYLLRRFERLTALDWAPGLLESLGKIRGAHLRRWPMELRETLVEEVLCYRCKIYPLKVYPPRDYGDPVLVQCPSCGHVVPESMFEHLRAVIEQGHREKGRKRADRPA